MEDAKITQEPREPLIKERFPSVVDTDDLIFELGKKEIKILNLEKLLNGLIEKSKAANQMVVDLSKVEIETTERIASLQESNKLYEENNRELDRELVHLRSKNGSYKQKIQKLESDLEEALKLKKIRRKKKTVG